MENNDADLKALEAELQQAITKFVVQDGEIIFSRLSSSLATMREVHNKLIDKASVILTNQKV